MRLRSKSKTNLAISLVLALTSAGLILAACSDDTTSFPAPSPPPNGGDHDAGSGSTSDAALPDLCACAVRADESDCRDCSKEAIAANGACASRAGTCQDDADCTADAICIGDCIHGDAGIPEQLACVSSCLVAATSKYTAYLGCLCLRCEVCQGEGTCPAP